MYLIMSIALATAIQVTTIPPQSRGIYDRKNKFYYHGGDLQGIIDRLPYLKDLGVTAMWLTPWYDNYDRPNKIELRKTNRAPAFTAITRRTSMRSRNTSAHSQISGAGRRQRTAQGSRSFRMQSSITLALIIPGSTIPHADVVQWHEANHLKMSFRPGCCTIRARSQTETRDDGGLVSGLPARPQSRRIQKSRAI